MSSTKVAERGVRLAKGLTNAAMCFLPALLLGDDQLPRVAVVVAAVAGAAAFSWVGVRAARLAVVDSGDALVVRNPCRTYAIPWADVAGLADGALDYGNGAPQWALRIDRADGTTVEAWATVWRTRGRERTVARLEEWARAHRVPSTLTGQPAARGAGYWRTDPANPERRRLTFGVGWTPFVLPSGAEEPDGLILWDPLPGDDLATRADRAQRSRDQQRSYATAGLVAVALAVLALLLFVGVDLRFLVLLVPAAMLSVRALRGAGSHAAYWRTVLGLATLARERAAAALPSTLLPLQAEVLARFDAAAVTLAEPGWYADPERAGQERWWDGTVWTASVRPAEVPTRGQDDTDAEPEPRPADSAVAPGRAGDRVGSVA